eukprot:gene10123-12415_t
MEIDTQNQLNSSTSSFSSSGNSNEDIDYNTVMEIGIPLESISVNKTKDSTIVSILTASSTSTNSTSTESLIHRKHNGYVIQRDEEYLRSVFEGTKINDVDMKSKSNKQKKFYKKQNELIDQFLTPIEENQNEDPENDIRVKIAINGSFLVNVLLFAMQITAAIITGSMVLIATSIDAFMDLLSGFILLMTAHFRKKKNYEKYPIGKSRMEPVGIIVFDSLMSTVSINLLMEGAKSLINEDKDIDMSIIRLTHSSSAMILATDHRNDITVNSFGLTMALLGTYVRWWLDPTGALIVALIILRSWISEAYEQIQLLIGKSASPEFLQKITYISLTHPGVEKVDTCRAFHVGNNLFVEVDIVLPSKMYLDQAHDIGESLQIKLESLPEVERAFVHIDYNFTHKPEHKRTN